MFGMQTSDNNRGRGLIINYFKYKNPPLGDFFCIILYNPYKSLFLYLNFLRSFLDKTKGIIFSLQAPNF